MEIRRVQDSDVSITAKSFFSNVDINWLRYNTWNEKESN